MRSIEKEPRVNEKIRVSEVRVVGPDGDLLGVMSTRDAMTLATSQNLDLVEVAPLSRPPVCRVMDYGRFKYEQSKRTRKARRKQQTTHLKEIRVRPKIDDHDYEFKMRNARKFLEHRDKVKVTVLFRGREIAYRDRGDRLLQRIEGDLADVAVVELKPRMEGRNLIQVLSPRPGVGVPKPKAGKVERLPEPSSEPAGRSEKKTERGRPARGASDETSPEGKPTE